MIAALFEVGLQVVGHLLEVGGDRDQNLPGAHLATAEQKDDCQEASAQASYRSRMPGCHTQKVRCDLASEPTMPNQRGLAQGPERRGECAARKARAPAWPLALARPMA